MKSNRRCLACGRSRKPSHEKRIEAKKPYHPDCVLLKDFDGKAWRKEQKRLAAELALKLEQEKQERIEKIRVEKENQEREEKEAEEKAEQEERIKKEQEAREKAEKERKAKEVKKAERETRIKAAQEVKEASTPVAPVITAVPVVEKSAEVV